jgi:dTDP-4-amino-4,6-dideoxygalactose transaminase
MRSLVNHGRDGIYLSIDDDDGKSEAELKQIASKRFKFESVGHSFRITEMEAALGLAQLEDWQEMVKKRRANAQYLNLVLGDLKDKLQLPAVRDRAEHSFMMYPIVMRDHVDKWPLCNYLESRGIETREMLPLIQQPCYKGMWMPAAYPIALNIDKCGFYIGCHQDLMVDDLDYVAEVFHDYFKQ